jgi:geranylgeranyl pyrophosphate synthase
MEGSKEPTLRGPNFVTSHLLNETPRPNNHSDLLSPKRKTSSREMLRAVKKSGSMNYARNKAREYAESAKQSLRGVKKLKNRKLLEDYVDYLWKRKE